MCIESRFVQHRQNCQGQIGIELQVGKALEADHDKKTKMSVVTGCTSSSTSMTARL